MKKISIFLSAFLLVSLFASAQASDLTKAVQGVWTAKVADAPYGYQDYKLTFKEVKGKCLVDIIGTELNLTDQELKEVDGKLIITVYVGESVKVMIWKEKDIVKGTADTSMGILPIEFTRPEKI